MIPRDDPQERRLARAVAADEADRLARARSSARRRAAPARRARRAGRGRRRRPSASAAPSDRRGRCARRGRRRCGPASNALLHVHRRLRGSRARGRGRARPSLPPNTFSATFAIPSRRASSSANSIAARPSPRPRYASSISTRVDEEAVARARRRGRQARDSPAHRTFVLDRVHVVVRRREPVREELRRSPRSAFACATSRSMPPQQPCRRRRTPSRVRRTRRTRPSRSGRMTARVRHAHRPAQSCTSSASRVTDSAFVPGSTPCPRLKMWPGRPPARASTSSAAASIALPRPEQQRGIEVALHAAVVADERPAVVERDAPVEADDVAARARHRRQQRRRAGAEVDRRHVDAREDARRPRRDELLVVRRRQNADPRVEELHHVCACANLRARGTRRSSRRAAPSARSTPPARRTSAPSRA